MTDTQPNTETVTVNIDGQPVEARPGEMVIAAAERAGTYIPRFCYHPRLEPVGMCRMCLVNIDSGRGPMLQPACVVPVADGMTVDTQAPTVAKAQDGVLEFLLINHPLDCPVCDKGGECPLQDQTFAFGPGESRFVEEKRHYEKPIPISDLVHLDRERCILCDRCTRFADDVAGDPLISFVERGNETQVLNFPDHPFASYFSGNTVQLCPVGALTAAPYRFKARPWDLTQTESTCTTCSVGCRVAVQSSQDEVVRLVGVDVDPVNHGWLCDKGRFGYEATHGADRITAPMRRVGDSLEPTGWADALDFASTALGEATDPASVAVIGGARLTNEDAYAWSRLARSVIGTDNVDCQLGDGLPASMIAGVPRATIDEACRADVVVLLAPDLKEELPVLHLRLRAAAVDGRTKIIEISPTATGLSPHAAVRLHHRPGRAADVMRAIRSGSVGPELGVDEADISAARDLLGVGGSDADGPDVVCVLGRPSLAERAEATVVAADVLVDAVAGVRFLPALRRGNVMGAIDAGLAPGLLPGRVSLEDGRGWFGDAWGSVPGAAGLDTQGILEAAKAGKIAVLVLLGADPLVDFPDRQLAADALAAARTVIALDAYPTASVARAADVVLPVALAHEKTGSTTNIEGRVSRLSPKVSPAGTVRQDWAVAVELARRLGKPLPWESIGEIWAEIAAVSPAHDGITASVLADPAWADGVLVPLPSTRVDIGSALPAGEDATSHVEGENQPTHTSAEVETAEVAAVDNAPNNTASHAPPSGGADDAPAPEGPADHGVARPTSLVHVPHDDAVYVPPADSYALRLVAGRDLYDGGVTTTRSPALAPLAKGTRAAINPYDAERLGVASGDRVRVATSRLTAEVDVEVTESIPKGSVRMAFAQPGTGAADIIDVAEIVNDVRVETL